jgi:hypothetical protein
MDCTESWHRSVEGGEYRTESLCQRSCPGASSKMGEASTQNPASDRSQSTLRPAKEVSVHELSGSASAERNVCAGDEVELRSR